MSHQRRTCGSAPADQLDAMHPCGESGVDTRLDANLDFVRQVAAKAGLDLGG